MSREIKFKVWDKKNQSWLNPIGQLLINSSGLVADYYFNYFSALDPSEIELVEFTGLLDKNGKEIFENDIVCWTFDEKTKKEIVFHEGCFGHFIFMGINSEYSEFIPIHKKRAENMIVCGSIYQNPELLGGENE